jgi:hypothetical protein
MFVCLNIPTIFFIYWGIKPYRLGGGSLLDEMRLTIFTNFMYTLLNITKNLTTGFFQFVFFYLDSSFFLPSFDLTDDLYFLSDESL